MNRSTVGIVFAGMLGVLGCERSEPTTPTRTSPSPSTSAPRNDAQVQQISQWRRQLDDSKVKVEALRAKSLSSADASKPDFQNAVTALQDQIDKIQVRLDDFRGTMVSNWDSSKNDVDSMFSRLNNSLRDCQDKYGNLLSAPITPPATSPTPEPAKPGPGG
jgi:hypothetical protein